MNFRVKSGPGRRIQTGSGSGNAYETGYLIWFRIAFFFTKNEHFLRIIYIRIDEMLFWSLVYVEKTAGMDPCHCDLNSIWDTDRGGF